jgi:hypothetical protein
MYIGVCDWSETRWMQKVIPSLYAFAMEQDFIDVKKMCWWVTLELFLFMVNLKSKFPSTNGQTTPNNF